MKKRALFPISVLLCLALLAGCRTMVPGRTAGFSVEDVSKAQTIVAYDASGTEKAVLTEEADIEAFVEAMDLGGWRFAELPEGLDEAGSLTFWQSETVTALMGDHEAAVNEICTFRVYQNENYLTIETALVDIPFSIPRETADYLRSLTA